MGSIVSYFEPKKPQVTVLMIGLENTGKSTILYKLNWGEVLTNIPVIGMEVETVENRNIIMRSMDVGGRGTIRPMIRCYLHQISGLIFCVDASDSSYVEESRRELAFALENAPRNIPLLVLANKMDLKNAMSASEIAKELKLEDVRDRQWHIISSCALTGAGLHEGFDWLWRAIENFEKNKDVSDKKIIASK